MKTSLRPWHKVVDLREDIKTGELPLSIFAADLFDVVMQMGRRPVYESPSEFFALTYPTLNLRELAKDVCYRLDGRTDRAYRKLSVNYGGGKTHTLIALRHLVHDPDSLPDHRSVKEFQTYIGFKPPRARVAALCFDKIDVEKGIQTHSPDGEARMLRHPWSVLAFQVAGAEGLRIIHAEGQDEERNTPPAEPLMIELLSKPQDEGLATLVLLDEVLMYLRALADVDPSSPGRMVNFFQYLSQAIAKVDKCCMVASLLASDPRKYDDLGKEILQSVSEVFGRQNEEDASPVTKDDVAEVLRRRFFKPESTGKTDEYRQWTSAVVRNISGLDDNTNRSRQEAEARYLRSYPFHPELIEIFYVRWTQLPNFQQARGMLRTYALALRDAMSWDTSPIVGPNIFLGEPDRSGLSEAAGELATLARVDTGTGNYQQWSTILEGELDKARYIQSHVTGLRHREIEQAVFSVFLSSQPIGQKAQTNEVMALVGAGNPDRIEMEKGLYRWTELSWFLDEEDVAPESGISPDGTKRLPSTWRLGNRPNLRQMHDDACRNRVQSARIEAEMLSHIGRLRALSEGASSIGAKTHTLPDGPKDVADDGEFRYAILGPEAASMPGNPSAKAKTFIDQSTSTERPRVHRNAVILAVPSRDGIDAVRDRIREHLGWLEVARMLQNGSSDEVREHMLSRETTTARNRIPEAIKQAYCIVVTVNESNSVHAFKVPISDEPLFLTIKSDARSRIEETAISSEAMLPGGPYDLWRNDEESRRVNDLVNAFASFPKLPKMVSRSGILATIARGVRDGIWVARVSRPDHTSRTFWRTEVDEAVLRDPSAELVLPESAVLSEIDHELLAPNALPGLWTSDEIMFGEVVAYFAGGHTVTVPMDGYDEVVSIPGYEEAQVKEAVEEAVSRGTLWMLDGPTSLFKDPVPPGVLSDSSKLLPPPDPIATHELMQTDIPEAWHNSSTNGFAILTALNRKHGRILPWATVKTAIHDSIKARWIELESDSVDWDCDYGNSQNLKLRIPSRPHTSEIREKQTPSGILSAEAALEIYEVQDLAERIHEIVAESAGNNLRINVRIELGGEDRPEPEVVNTVNKLLSSISEELRLN